MTQAGRPPRLLVRTLAVTFVTVAVLLVMVFSVVWVSTRSQVRESVAANLSASQRVFAALETRRQREMLAQTGIVADSPTLKAAFDTYQQETRGGQGALAAGLVETIDIEVEKLAGQLQSGAIVLTDLRQNILSSAGPFKERWPRGKAVQLTPASGSANFDGIARMGGAVFRISAVPMQASDGTVLGTLYLATSLDDQYANQLKQDSGAADVTIVSDGLVIASTLPSKAAHEFESIVGRSKDPDGVATLDGEEQAYRRLVAVGENTTFYALGSIDAQSRSAMRAAEFSLAIVGVAALVLALGASFWLARLLADPIGKLSSSLAAMARSHDVKTRLPLTGSSLEIDALTATFNELMASVAAAEADTEAAYTGAIRALATALDARDAYTAGHSERVSVLSVAMGRHLALPPDAVEVVRLGALLHDIGKIGVPDNVLMKPGKLTDAEFQTIKQHPVLGARILRSVPFLAPHIPIVELHHERPDGRGYPQGLRGDDIPLAARIVHVADAYDAMTTARAYRGARPSSEALQELWRCAGTEFHADIVDALAKALPGVAVSAEGVVVHA